jgi:hypothetical protein
VDVHVANRLPSDDACVHSDIEPLYGRVLANDPLASFLHELPEIPHLVVIEFEKLVAVPPRNCEQMTIGHRESVAEKNRCP